MKWSSLLRICIPIFGTALLNAQPAATTTYTISTVAGTGSPDFPQGDNGPATAAAIVPNGLAVDQLGNLFLIDGGSATAQRRSTVRKVDQSGVITTLACDGPDPLGGNPWGPILPAH